MNVSAIVTCYNEEKNIGGCLNSLLKQDYSSDKHEVIVVDGGSKDGTQAIIKEFIKTHSNISLVIELKKGTAVGRNSGVKAAHYDYIAFIDADCIAPADWLTLLVKNYQLARLNFDNVIGVGGRNITPLDADSFPKAVGIALDSYIGSFGSIQGRQFKSPAFVSSLSTANALYEKNKIIEIGYFDESLQSEAEDADINYRLNSCGNKFLYIPDSFVWHKMRFTPTAWLKNMFRYGKGRARLLKRYPKMWAFSYLLPLFFITLLITTAFMPFYKFSFFWILYLVSLFVFSLFQCIKKKSILLTPKVMLVYLIQHFGYAAGEIYGLVNPKVK